MLLQDARVSQQQMQVFYTQLVLTVRQLYQECHLVHADLSEYNILVHNVCPSRFPSNVTLGLPANVCRSYPKCSYAPIWTLPGYRSTQVLGIVA